VYVDGMGKLILYGIEHYNDGMPGTTRGVKVREFNQGSSEGAELGLRSASGWWRGPMGNATGQADKRPRWR
jgi:hypothetical protein